MTKFLLSSAAIVALSIGSAQAADLPLYQEQVAVSPVGYDWTGLYIGAHIGGGVGGDFEGDVGGVLDVELSAGGFLGGVQAGYNYQFGTGSGVVIGVEADISYAKIENDISLNLGGGLLTAGLDVETEYLATVRGRIGYAWDSILVYATGGVAFTEIEVSGNIGPFSASDKNTHTGYAIGAGVEAAIFGNWTAKAEYLYVDFDEETYFDIADVDLDSHILRVGLNYRF